MSKIKPLTKKEIKRALNSVSKEWKVDAKETKFSRTYTFTSPVEALSFIAKIIVHAEVQQHHPDIQFSYCTVKVSITTHDVKGLTQKDVTLLKTVDSLHSD